MVSLKGYLPEITRSLRLLMQLGGGPPNLASPRKHNLIDNAKRGGYSCFPQPTPDAREAWFLKGIRRIFPTLPIPRDWVCLRVICDVFSCFNPRQVTESGRKDTTRLGILKSCLKTSGGDVCGESMSWERMGCL